MRKYILLLLAALLALSSCGKAPDASAPSSASQTPTVQVTASEAAAEVTAAPSTTTATTTAATTTTTATAATTTSSSTTAVQTTVTDPAAETQPPASESPSFDRFSDYTLWAENAGYPSGLLDAEGSAGLNQDYFHTAPGSAGYSSGRIVVGDSRCCQLGIYQSRNGGSDFAAFAVWGGHYVSGYGGILTESHIADVEKCFQEQIRACGKCTIYFFATVNDYDCRSNNNSPYVSAAVAAAERLASLRYELDGAGYAPEIVVIGFDGCWTSGDLFGTPQEIFNRYIADYNASLEARTYASEALKGSLAGFSTVPEIAGGKADFIDDGLHYSDRTLAALSAYITGG